MGQNLPLNDFGRLWIKQVQANNFRAYYLFKNNLTAESAFAQGNQIRNLSRNIEHENEILDLISFIIVDFAHSVNVGKNITNFQVDEIAVLIYTRYKFLSVEELFVIFSRAKEGCYKTLYDRLDVTVISEYIKMYCESERASALEKINSSKSYKANNILEAIILSDNSNEKVTESQEFLKELLKNNHTQVEGGSLMKLCFKPNTYESDFEKFKRQIPASTDEELLHLLSDAISKNASEFQGLLQEEIDKRPRDRMQQAQLQCENARFRNREVPRKKK